MPRMRILSPSQQEAFDKPPLFDPLERQKFLNPSKTLLDIVARFRTPSGEIGFLLMAGYFKATKQFYQPQEFHERDVEFVALMRVDRSPQPYVPSTEHEQLMIEQVRLMVQAGRVDTALTK